MGRAAVGLIRPMLATSGLVPEGPRWSYEAKWDGIRCVAYADSSGTRLLSRNDRDLTDGYPEITTLVTDQVVVLDGELVALDQRGRPDFGLLQRRIHSRPSAQVLVNVPVRYYVFDVLRLGDRSTLQLPYTERRDLLDSLDLADHPRIDVPPSFAGAGAAVLAAAQEHGLEGTVAKRSDSTYHPGRRARSWIKTAIRRRQEVIIGGWTPGHGRRSGGIGALILGAYTDAGLTYIGDVGTGFTDRALDQLHRQLLVLQQPSCPFATAVPRETTRHARWVRPELVGDVEYRSWTGTAARRLRHPAWKGLRSDREASGIRLPPG